MEYCIYFLWLFALPRFLEVWKALSLYDARYSVPTNRKTKVTAIAGTVIQAGLFCLESILNLVGLKNTVSKLQTNPVTANKINSRSWITRNFSPGATGRIVSIHISLCQVATGLSLLYISILAYAIGRRIDLLIEGVGNLNRDTKVFYHKHKVPIDIDNLASQIQDLTEIFQSLRRASNELILAYIGFTTVITTLYAFLVLSYWQTVADIPLFAEFVVYMIIYFFACVLKLIIFTNSGETLFNKVKYT
jgi:hypothetical protein